MFSAQARGPALSPAERSTPRPAGPVRALRQAAFRPLPLALLALSLVSFLTAFPWIAAAALPVWALVVAGGTTDRLRALPPALSPATPRATPSSFLTPALAGRVERALRAEQAVRAELGALADEPPGLRLQVERLGEDLRAAASRAEGVDQYLAGLDVDDLRAREAACREDPRRVSVAEALREQLRVAELLRERRAALEDELEHVELGLGAVRGHLVGIRTGAAVPGGLREDVSALGDRVRAVADGFSEAYGHNEPH